MRYRPGLRGPLLFLLVAAIWCALPSASSSAAAWAAPLPEPLTVTRPFDPPANPYGSGHRGVDLAGVPGQEIRAAGPGTVIYAGPLAGRGVISIAHADGLRTTYEPVQATISAGVQVPLGQVIGTLLTGHAGCPAAACLHWGLKRGEVYLDPLPLLIQGPVRLLPRYSDATSATALEPAMLLPAAPVALGVLRLGLGLLPLASRRQCTRAACKPRNPRGAMRTERRTYARQTRGAALAGAPWRGVRRVDALADRQL